jgi:hypothetical protein
MSEIGGYESLNKNYRVWLSKGSSIVSTPMAENFSTSLDITWNPILAGGMQEAMSAMVGGNVTEWVNKTAAAGGFNFQNKQLSAQLWQGSSYISYNIPFVFKVEKDPQRELVEPIKEIMKMALPREFGPILKAPYTPMLPDSETNSPVEVRFGNFMVLKNCVITNISQTYDAIFDSDGRPLSAKLDVSVISTYIIVYDDIQTMFKH